MVHIANGSTVNAGWTKHIAISNDGVNWNAIHKENLLVSQRQVNTSKGRYNSTEFVKNGHWIVTIKDNEENIILSFDPNTDIANQAGWTGNTAAKAQTAVLDITVWLGS